MVACQTLLFENVARCPPEISFVHSKSLLAYPLFHFYHANIALAVPGVMKSGISRKPEGIALNVKLSITSVFDPFIQTPPDDCGEFYLMAATSATYPPNHASVATSGVLLVGKIEVP